MTETQTLTDKINRTLRTGLAGAMALLPMAAAQGETPVAPALESSVVHAYTEDNGYCPSDMLENGFKISGKEGIARLNDMLDVSVKRSVFGTSDLTSIDVDTISFNLGNDDAYAVTGDRSVPVRVSYGTNIEKDGNQGILVATADNDTFITRNLFNQSVTSDDRNPLSAELYDVRQALCQLEEQILEENGARSIVGGPEGIGARGGSEATQNASLAGPATQGPAYNIGSGLTGHAVSARFSIDDVLSALPIGEAADHSVSFESGRAAIARAHDGLYTIVAALGEDAGVQEIARVTVATDDGTYAFPITARAGQAADEYAIRLGTEEDNRALNEAGVNLADNWKQAEFALGNENYGVERSFSNRQEAAASESRRGYNEIVYDPQSGAVFGTYDIGTARFTPKEGLSPLEAAIHNSNNAQVVGVDIAYEDSHAIMTGAYDPNSE